MSTVDERDAKISYLPAERMRPPGAIKTLIMNWLGMPVDISQPGSTTWGTWGGSQTHSGEIVTPNSALQNETVWACVGLIAETIATLPLTLYKRAPFKTPAPQHPLYNVLRNSPSADMATHTLIECLMLSLLLWGNAFAEIVRVGSRVVAIVLLPPELMAINRVADGSLEYTWNDSIGKRQIRGETDILHIVGRTLNGMIGLSPIAYARHVMGGAMAADKMASKMFSQGLLFTGTFETDLPIKEEQRARFQQRLREYQGAINAGRAPLLEGGIKYKPISINPNDAQMLQTRQFSVEQICRWFRVPPHMVGHTTNSTSFGTGIEEQKMGFLTFTLQIWLTRIEAAINRKLLSPGDQLAYFCEFNFEGLLRADSTKRAAFYMTMTQNGIYTRDDCRKLESLAPMGGNADVLTIMSNMLPIDKLGEAVAAPTATPPPGTPTP